MNKQLTDNLTFTGEVKWIKEKDGDVVAESDWEENQIVASAERGIYLLLDRLGGDNTYSTNITHGDIGTNDTTPTESDTDLGNAVHRAQVALTSRSGKQLTLRFFFPDQTTNNNTYNEFGMYVDGDATISTGRIFNHVLFSEPIVKQDGESHTIVCRVTATV